MINYSKDGFAGIPENLYELAIREIHADYGDRVRLHRGSLHKFGRNRTLGTATEVVSFDGLAPLTSATNSIDRISSSNNADTQEVYIEGMTISGGLLTFVTQTVTLTGQTPVAIGTPLSSVTYARIGSTEPTPILGDVYMYENGATTLGIPNDLNTVGAVLTAEAQSTVHAFVAVANDYYFLLSFMYADVNKKTAATADVELQTKSVGGTWIDRKIRSTSNNNNLDCPFEPYLIVPPNTYIRLVMSASTNDVDVAAGFAGVFADIIS